MKKWTTKDGVEMNVKDMRYFKNRWKYRKLFNK